MSLADDQKMRKTRFQSLLQDLPYINSHQDEVAAVKIENCIGFVNVPVGLAGPLQIQGGGRVDQEVYAPLATREATLVASCSRGCKALSVSGGVHYQVLGEGMSRAPAFLFPSPTNAILFMKRLPHLLGQLAKDAESTSRHVRLQKLTPHIIGSAVHVHFSYKCGEAAGQNMVTIATQRACDQIMCSELAVELGLKEIIIEGQMASDKKPSWGNVKEPRGMEVMVWGTLTDEVCRNVLGCSAERLYRTQMVIKEGGIRNGQFGSNINTANITAAMFIACGQDAASVAEGSWSQLTSEYDHESKELLMSLYFPSLPIGTVGGGTSFKGPSEVLNFLDCKGPASKERLAGLIASFSLALDVSTSAAIANHTFTKSHQTLARGSIQTKL